MMLNYDWGEKKYVTNQSDSSKVKCISSCSRIWIVSQWEADINVARDQGFFYFSILIGDWSDIIF